MSNFPISLDDDTTLPVVNDNLTEIGGEAINALRDAVFNIEMNIGLGAAGTTPSIAARIGLLINPDGTPNVSTITSLGLVTLPIYNYQIADNAGIQESKLQLDYPTLNLFNYIRDLSRDVNIALGWISVSGIKLEPHLVGVIYRHDLAQIDVAEDPTQYLNNVFRQPRDNSDSYQLINDINNELLAHQWADGSPINDTQNIITNDGSTYPSNFGHTASGIYVNTSRFQTIPQTDQDVQSALEYIDESSILLLGTRIQNLYANGISVNSRSSSLPIDGYGQPIVPITPATAYLLGQSGTSSSPVDNINFGDDIIQFNPSNSLTSSNLFDAQFALVQVGDIIRINYGTVEVSWVISEIKYNQSGPNKTYVVRIAGKNLAFTTAATARIDRPLFNNNKYGVLSIADTNSIAQPSVPTSLIVANPRGAQALGIGFNPDQLDNTHYLLYLALYPDGNPNDGYTILPAIDVTGNAGATPGSYTLDSVVAATNAGFRAPGYNYRFIAFENDGEFGIMLADSYNNVSFSILNMIVTANGLPDPVNTPLNFPNNVVGGLVDGYNYPDPLGFGFSGANIASPPYQTSYGSPAASQYPTKLFVPLRRNNYYVNGVEREQLNTDVDQILDQYGDGYWIATIDGYSVIPGSPGQVMTTYNIPYNLSTSSLRVGSTIVVQSLGFGSLVDFGRFIINNVTFVTTNCTSPYTLITVYDSVHAAGISPTTTLATSDGYGDQIAIYFNSDSVAFDAETATDFTTPVGATFRRHFEVYVDSNGSTYTHERARLNTSGTNITVNGVVTLYSSPALSCVNIVSVSPKLVGFSAGAGVFKINLQIFFHDLSTGVFDGYLCNYNGTSITTYGPMTVGQGGQVTRFYDQTNIDYIDIIFQPSSTNPLIPVPSFTNQNIDIQLFPTLSLDEEIMLLGTCQFDNTTQQTSYLEDRRQFGNISEEQLTDSAIDFIEAPTRELHENGIIRGFDITGSIGNDISFSGGTALVNGKLVQLNTQVATIPIVLEALPIIPEGYPTITSTVPIITWFVCVNDQGEIRLVASTDFNPLGAYASQYAAADLSHLRLFYVMNPNASAPIPYQVRGTYFAGLVYNQPDVVPIAVVTATVTSTGGVFSVSSMVINDARRYVTNGYGGLAEPMTLGDSASFTNFNSLTTWLYQFNNFFSASTAQSNPISNKVIVKGHVPIFATVGNFATPLGFTFGEVYFEGDNGVFDVYVPTGLEIGSNVHFDKLTFNYFYDPVVYSDPDYVTTDLINTGKGLIHLGVAALNGAVRNVSITNSHFIWSPLTSGIPANDAGPTPPSSSTSISRYSFINVEFNQATGTQPLVLQDVNISDNTFQDNTFSSFTNQDTSLAVISFVCLSNIAGDYLLTNATVRKNTCDKDQMIAIVPANTATTNTVTAAITTTNCIIQNNNCGAISVFTSYTAPFDIGLTSNYLNLSLDKNSNLIVEGNTCKYITCTDARGVDLFYNFANPNGSPNGSILINTGAINVENNTCSWIRLLPNVSTSAGIPTSYTIKNNILLGYNTNFRFNYLDGYTPGSLVASGSVSQAQLFVGAQTNAAIEIILPSQSVLYNLPLAILNRSDVIDGNWIAGGIYETVVPFLTNFYYDYGVRTMYNANICHNTISGLVPTLTPSTNPIGIQLAVGALMGTATSSHVHHNRLCRVTTNWRAYIDAGGGTHSITNNFFDAITPDGVNTQNEIIGSTGLSNIHDNTNHVVTAAFSLMDSKTFYVSSGGSYGPTTGPAYPTTTLFADGTNGVQVNRVANLPIYNVLPPLPITADSSSMYTLISEIVLNGLSPAPSQRNLSFVIPLDTVLPPGVKIVNAQVGIWAQTGGAAGAGFDTSYDGYNAFTLALTSYNPNFPVGNVRGLLDVKNSLTPTAVLGLASDFSLSNQISQTVQLSNTPGSFPPSLYKVSTATAASNTQFLIAFTTLNDQVGWVTGAGYRVSVQLDLNWLRLGISGDTVTTIYVSPVIVAYTW